MCESKAVIIENGEEKTIMDDIVFLEKTNQGYVLHRIDGKKLELPRKYRLVRIDFLKHTIYFATD